ncbi:MAG: gliding motility-associated C-terminal domain-containing protein [Bacteroidia bacterium]|nr:gliding motility-associated C-terminal domain-containing protein [Bacteroidia bacterium]
MDQAGFVYQCGSFEGPLYGLTNAGNSDAYLAKFHPNGAFLWAFSISGTANQESWAVETDAAGNVYIGGKFESTVDFKGRGIVPQLKTSNGKGDLFIAKYDSSGVFQWVQTPNVGSALEEDQITALAIQGNRLFASGFFEDNVSLGASTLNQTGARDGCILALDLSGNMIWTRGVTGVSGNEEALGITADQNSVYVHGSFSSGNVKFQTGPPGGITGTTQTDIFVCSFGQSGAYRWAIKINSNKNNKPGGIRVDSTGIYLSGAVDCGNTGLFLPGFPTQTGSNGQDIFWAKLRRSNGNVRWIKRISDNNTALSEAHALASGPFGRLFVGGHFNSTTNFETPASVSQGGEDLFLAQIDTSTGGILWLKTHGSNGNDRLWDLVVGSQGSIYAAGTNWQAMNFDAIAIPDAGEEDPWVGSIEFTVDAIPDHLCVLENQADTFNLLLNDAWLQNDTLNVNLLSVANGAGTFFDDTTFVYQPAVGFTGRDSLKYSICNQYGDCDTVISFVEVLPIAQAGNDTVLCNVGPYTLNGNNPVTGSGLWTTLPGPAIASPTQPSTTVSGLNPGYNQLIWTLTSNFGGCTSADTLVIQSSPVFTAGLSGDATICQGDSTPLELQITGLQTGPYAYQYTDGFQTWQDSGQTSLTLQWLVAPSVTTQYSLLQVTDTLGCAAGTLSGMPTISVLNYPVQSLGNDTSFCTGDSLTLDAGNPGDIYLWSTGATSQSLNIHTPGTYTVEVIHGGLCLTSDTIIALLQNPPVVSLGQDTSICTGDTLQLDAGNSGANYFWSDGSTGMGLAATVPGWIWVEVSLGCLSRDSLFLTLLALPQVNLGADTLLCPGDSLALDASGTGVAWWWSTGSNAAQIQLQQAGTVWVEVTDSNGCQGRDTLSLQYFPFTPPTLGPDTALCAQDSFVLNANAPAGYQTIWSNGSTAGTLFAFPNQQYALTFLDTSSGCKGGDSISISLLPAAPLDLGPDTAYCAGDSVLLDAGPGASSYLWSDGSTTQTLWVNAPGTIWAMIVDGCPSARDSVVITENVLPLVDLGPDTLLCYGANVVLQAGSGNSFLWSDGGTQAQAVVYQAGIWWVTVTDANLCQGTDTVLVEVAPGPGSFAGLDSLYCRLDPPVTLNGLPANGHFSGPGVIGNQFFPNLAPLNLPVAVTWIWNDSTQCIDSLQSVTLIQDTVSAQAGPDQDVYASSQVFMQAVDPAPAPGVWTLLSGSGIAADPGLYNSQVTGLGPGANIFLWTVGVGNCITTDEVVLQLPQWNLETGISPNGDGLNETLNFPGLETMGDNTLLIFNRWGQLVYRRQNYQNDWAGTNLEGRTLTDDTYYFTLTLSNIPELKGYVVVRR